MGNQIPLRSVAGDLKTGAQGPKFAKKSLRKKQSLDTICANLSVLFPKVMQEIS